MLFVTPKLSIPMSEIEVSAIRSSGPGGQNVNAVATAVQLRFDVRGSTLPLPIKQRLLRLRDRRLTRAGVLVIKAQTARTQEANRQEALRRLQEVVEQAAAPPRVRRPTKPSRGARERRLENKRRRRRAKSLRGRVKWDEGSD
jgi:ribosome-associated protein